MKSDLVYITDPIEHTFAEAVMDAGLIIYPGPEVISPIPVKDAHGPGYRTLMHADYEVVRQRRKRSYSAVVELTKSKRSTPGKKTQLRIALAAGLPNYHQLEPQFVQELPHLLQTPKRRTLIDQLGLKKQK